ncbi:MAG TPA: hypothetical protein DIU05_12700 [Bacteroidetes bacterium]|nr:hypothetical protein [Bacteroidota bacterium]
MRLINTKTLLLGVLTLIAFNEASAQWTTLTNNLAPYQIRRNNITFFSIDTFGQVWVKTPGVSNQFRFSVDGWMRVREIYVNNDGWADYVFDDAYKLLPLNELDLFIRKNKHLPNIPTAAQVKEKQLPVGDTQRLLLEKVEELTLYIIRQQKEIDELKKIVSTK